jgi:hypothetical protein
VTARSGIPSLLKSPAATEFDLSKGYLLAPWKPPLPVPTRTAMHDVNSAKRTLAGYGDVQRATARKVAHRR